MLDEGLRKRAVQDWVCTPGNQQKSKALKQTTNIKHTIAKEKKVRESSEKPNIFKQ